jgi:hypothetical protein
MFRSFIGSSSGLKESRSMLINVKFMEVLQLDGMPSVLQSDVKLYITIKPIYKIRLANNRTLLRASLCCV